MAEKARLFHDNLASELILCSSDPQSHKRIGRSFRGLDDAIKECERETPLSREPSPTFR